jgi:hypothetical protein
MKKLLYILFIAGTLASCRNENKPAAEELRQDDPTNPNPDTGSSYHSHELLFSKQVYYYC